VVGLFTGHCHLKDTFSNWNWEMVPLRTVRRIRWISHAYPMRLWGYSLYKISSHGPVLYGTKWLLWRPHK
jgi:hypothetical protein